jgi:hypothetical protein
MSNPEVDIEQVSTGGNTQYVEATYGCYLIMQVDVLKNKNIGERR